jgi:hypothetical protein
MEDVLTVYQCAHDEAYPLVCMDESTQQLIGEVHPPQPGAPGRVERVDHEYVRNGVATLFLEVAPLAGKRHVQVTERRARCDWAEFVRGMVDERYPSARKIRLVLDNLNTHSAASLYAAFPPPRRTPGSHSRRRHHAAFRRRQSEPVFPPRLQPRPRHRFCHQRRRYAGKHAFARARPGLRRFEFYHP